MRCSLFFEESIRVLPLDERTPWEPWESVDSSSAEEAVEVGAVEGIIVRSSTTFVGSGFILPGKFTEIELSGFRVSGLCWRPPFYLCHVTAGPGRTCQHVGPPQEAQRLTMPAPAP